MAHGPHPSFSRTPGDSPDASPLSPESVAPADPRRAFLYGALHTPVHAVPLGRPQPTLRVDGPEFGLPKPLHPQAVSSPVLWARASLFSATALWCLAYVRGAVGRSIGLLLTGILDPWVSGPTRRLLPPKQACTLLGPRAICLFVSAAQGLLVAPGRRPWWILFFSKIQNLGPKTAPAGPGGCGERVHPHHALEQRPSTHAITSHPGFLRRHGGGSAPSPSVLQGAPLPLPLTWHASLGPVCLHAAMP